jgi:hypothetical protein
MPRPAPAPVNTARPAPIAIKSDIRHGRNPPVKVLMKSMYSGVTGQRRGSYALPSSGRTVNAASGNVRGRLPNRSTVFSLLRRFADERSACMFVAAGFAGRRS